MAIRHNYDYAVDSSKGNVTYASVAILAQDLFELQDYCYDDVDVERRR